jgi:hypothetical protein
VFGYGLVLVSASWRAFGWAAVGRWDDPVGDLARSCSVGYHVGSWWCGRRGGWHAASCLGVERLMLL